MPTIRRLPETLVNRIAAGEVVERPAAALKELVENAVDADASRIVVRLTDGGLTRIDITDDGCGMSSAEMVLALERHATSKLPDEAIEQVATLGFRGEALPSIASVSRMTLESRTHDAADGWRKVVDHGTLLEDGPAALPPGTRIRVEQVFEKLPARRKFLRTARSEYGAALDVVRRLAMARPDIAFTLEKDGRTVLNLQAGQGWRSGLRPSSRANWQTTAWKLRWSAARCGCAELPDCRPIIAAWQTTSTCSSTDVR